MRAGDVADLADSYDLDVDPDRPNVILHVVDDDAWPFDDGEQVAPRPVVAVGLLDADDERSRRAGQRLVVAHSVRTVGPTQSRNESDE